jgi:hypothetical protein
MIGFRWGVHEIAPREHSVWYQEKITKAMALFYPVFF